VILKSKILKADFPLYVRLPPSYRGTAYRYPVVYLLDGQWNQHHTGGTALMLERHGLIPECIIVGFDSPDRWRYFTPTVMDDLWASKRYPGMTTGDGAVLADVIEREVVPFVEQRYRTASHRTIAGSSLGGLMSAWLLLTRPEPWEAFILSTPALWWNRGEWVDHADGRIRKISGKKAVWLDHGSEGGRHARAVRRFRKLFLEQAPQRLRFHYRHFKRDDHGIIILLGFNHALRFIFEGWAYDRPHAGGTAAGMRRHVERVGKRYGLAPRPPENIVGWCAKRKVADGKVAQARALYGYGLEWYPRSKAMRAGLRQLDARRLAT
jgi:predicted alpha/beta superfamily hydrolase